MISFSFNTQESEENRLVNSHRRTQSHKVVLNFCFARNCEKMFENKPSPSFGIVSGFYLYFVTVTAKIEYIRIEYMYI
jgi:hypothetical protein